MIFFSKTMKIRQVVILFFISLLFYACDDDVPTVNQDLSLSSGVFIVNEGNFTANNGDISFYNPDTDTLVNALYALQNDGAHLGDVVQSLALTGDTVFISVNNSSKIEVVDKQTFKHLYTISGLSYPRYIISGDNGRIYATNGQFPGELLIIDTQTYAVENRIELGASPENLLIQNEKLFVANGAWGYDSTVSVIDINTNQILKNISVCKGVTDLCAVGDLYIATISQYTDDENNTFINVAVINTVTYFSEEVYNFNLGTASYFAPRISANSAGDIFYIDNSGLRKISRNAGTSGLIVAGDFYGLEINPQNDNLYLFDAKSFMQDSDLLIYDSEGNFIRKHKVGRGANGAVFF